LIQREHSLGAATALGFDDDDDIVVFVPASADVFRCPKQDWRALVGLNQSGGLNDKDGSDNQADFQGAINLKAALIKSGVNFG
jgi:hypothetical protein